MNSLRFAAGLLAAVSLIHAQPAEPEKPLIPIHFELKEPGFVTLVIDDANGKRVRNLISQEEFPAGKNTVWWNGLDDRDRDPNAAEHAIFHIPGKMVSPGKYTVRGLTHPGIDLIYQLSPYTSGNPPWRTDDPGSQWLTNHSAPSDVIFLPAGQAPEREGKPTSKGGQLMICSRVAEGGSGLAWVDIDGKKLFGQHWLGGVWTAASHLAIDQGDQPVNGVYAYAAASWPGDKYNQYKSELRLHKLVDAEHRRTAPKDKRMGTGEDLPVLEPNYEIPLLPGAPPLDTKDERAMKAYRNQYSASLTGLAVRNGLVVSAFEKLNQLLFVDARSSKVLGTAEVPQPRGLAFDQKGNLYVLSEGRVLRYSINAEQPEKLSAPQTVVKNLDDPQRVTIGPDGTLYVSVWGEHHQVQIFNADGNPIGAIGDAGPPQIGKYNPNHLNQPSGVALDDQGRIWIAENTHIPKRVSVWNVKDRTLAKAFYGPMRYGGSGAIDPQDKTTFFYDDDHGGTIQFKLNYETGESTPVAILYLDAANQTGLMGRYVGEAPSYPLHHGKFTYLTDAYSQSTSGRRSAALWRLDPDGIVRIVAAAGNILDSAKEILPAFRDPAVQAMMPKGYDPASGKSLLFVWSDANGNQKVDAAEVQFLNPKEYADAKNSDPNTGTASVTDDLAFTFSSVGNAVLQVKPTTINEAGIPSYDLTKRAVLATGTQSPASSGGNQILPAKDGWIITTTPLKPFARQGLGGARNGEPIWSYPSLWPGLHAAHIAPLPEGPGQVIGTTRVIGPVIDAPPGSDAGQLWAINADKGTIYVFTVDGLFVARLFQDSRSASWNAPEAKRGLKVNDLSLQEECFGPIWTRTDSGEVFLQGGGSGNIVQVENLNQIRRLPDQTILVTSEQLQAAQQWNIAQETKRQTEASAERRALKIATLSAAPALVNESDPWKNADWALIDRRKQQVGNWGKREVTTRAAAAISGDKLFVTWQTYDKDLLRSSGESLNNLFKTGGALDLMIGVDSAADPNRSKPVKGDQRLLMTQVKGKTVAALYEPVSPDAKASPVEFGSPLRTIQFDRVTDVSDRIQLTSTTVKDLKMDKAGSISLTTYLAAIPLDLLGMASAPEKPLKFDVGILRGDGQQTLQRSYWHNKASGLVSDIPSEAELLPQLWGEAAVAK